MAMLRTALLAGVSAAFCAGAAIAAEPQWRTMSVDLPDGSVAQIRYVGDIAPQVTVSMPVVQGGEAVETIERIEERVANGGIPRARRVIQPPPAYAYQPEPRITPVPQFVVADDQPWGMSYTYSVITTNPDGKVCTQRTEWMSRGAGREPRITHTDTGEGCAAPSIR